MSSYPFDWGSTTKRKHQNVMVSSDTDDDSSRKRNYHNSPESWKSDEISKKDSTFAATAYCSVCDMDVPLQAGSADLKAHAKSTMHIEMSRAISKQPPVFDVEKEIKKETVQIPKQELGQGSSHVYPQNIKKEDPGTPWRKMIPSPLQPPKRIKVKTWSFFVMGMKIDSLGKITKFACTHLEMPRENFTFNVDNNPTSLKEELTRFMGYLPTQTILISHDSDFSKSNSLLKNMIDHSLLSLLKGKVLGFCDSYEIFNQKLKPFLKSNCKNFDFTKGFNNILLRETYNLAELISKKVSEGVQRSMISESSRTVDCAIEEMQYCVVVDGNLDTFEHLICGSHLSKDMALKIARSGLKFCHIEFAFQRYGSDGLRELLNPRVTRDTGVIAKLCCALQQ